MSNISRRKFLKGAGAAALAVAAAGVLAGCSNDKIPGTDVPDTPVTSTPLKVYFVGEDGNGVGDSVNGIYETTVLKDAKKYDPKLIPAEKLPEGYDLASNDLVDIIDNGYEYVIAMVPVQKKSAKPAEKTRVKVTLMFTTPGEAARDLIVDIDKVNVSEVQFADIEKGLYETYDDVEVVDTTWYSPISIDKGCYTASRPLAVKIKGSQN